MSVSASRKCDGDGVDPSREKATRRLHFTPLCLGVSRLAPEKRLVLAVIERAFIDVFPYECFLTGKIRKGLHTKPRPIDRVGALVWLLIEEIDEHCPWSLGWCCRELGSSGGLVRDNINRNLTSWNQGEIEYLTHLLNDVYGGIDGFMGLQFT
jgi:hypothetical protein